MRSFTRALLSAIALACSIGCSGTAAPPTIHASDYNQSCQGASDCVLIDEGSSCCGSCGNAAINIADKAKYDAAAQQRQSSCKDSLCPAIACAFSMAYCNAGKCDACHQPGCGSAADGGTHD